MFARHFVYNAAESCQLSPSLDEWHRSMLSEHPASTSDASVPRVANHISFDFDLTTQSAMISRGESYLFEEAENPCLIYFQHTDVAASHTPISGLSTRNAPPCPRLYEKSANLGLNTSKNIVQPGPSYNVAHTVPQYDRLPSIPLLFLRSPILSSAAGNLNHPTSSHGFQMP